KAIIRAAQKGVRDWANGQTLEDLEMDPERIKRIRQMNEERVHIWGDTPHVISIHGRTLAQHYKGDANWDAIAAAAEIVRKTGTLIFGNGDIHTLYQAAQRIRTTGVSGVLIGRASFGNPWLFRDREQLKKLLNAGINPTAEDLPE